MALRNLVRSNYGGKLPVSVKYENLHSFKELVILCQSILETQGISHLHGSALFYMAQLSFTWLSSLYNPLKQISFFLSYVLNAFLFTQNFIKMTAMTHSSMKWQFARISDLLLIWNLEISCSMPNSFCAQIDGL